MSLRTLARLGLVPSICALAAASCADPSEGEGPVASHALAQGTAGASGGEVPGAAGAGSVDPIDQVYAWVDAPDSAFIGQPFSVGTEVSAWYGPVSDVDYTLKVTGAFSLDAVSLDPYGAMMCGAAVLTADGATIHCHADLLEYRAPVTLGLTPTAEGTISVAAELSVGGVPRPTSTWTTSVTPADSAELTLSGGMQYQALVGQPGMVSLYAYNSGPLSAPDTNLSLTLGGAATLTSLWCYNSSSGAELACGVDGATATCSLAELLAGQGFSCDLEYLPTAEGEITIAANVGSAVLDHDPRDNIWSGRTDAVHPTLADLAVRVEASRPAVLGRPLTYTITATNNGPDAVTSVYVSDWLPYSATLVSATPSQGSCETSWWAMAACDLGSLDAGASATVEVVVAPQLGGTLTNSVEAYGSGPWYSDPDWSNNTAEISVDVRGTSGGATPAPGRAHGKPSKRCPMWPGLPIDDLEDGDITGGHGLAEWFIFNDGTGTQVPSAVEGLVVPGGPRSSRFMARSSGDSFWYWGAGFGIGFECHDVSRFTGVEFDALATEWQSFFVELSTSELQPVEFGGTCEWGCSDFHRAAIDIGGDGWQRCTVPFSALSQAGWGRWMEFDPGSLMSVQYNFESLYTPYDLAVDNLHFTATPLAGVQCVPIER